MARRSTRGDRAGADRIVKDFGHLSEHRSGDEERPPQRPERSRAQGAEGRSSADAAARSMAETMSSIVAVPFSR